MVDLLSPFITNINGWGTEDGLNELSGRSFGFGHRSKVGTTLADTHRPKYYGPEHHQDISSINGTCGWHIILATRVLLTTVNDFFAPKPHTQAIAIGRGGEEDKEKQEKN